MATSPETSQPTSRLDVAITAIGMATSLGTDMANACAAARAGLTRPSELKCLNVGMHGEFGKETLAGPPVVIGHQVPGIMHGLVGFARILALGAAALDGALDGRGLSAKDLEHTSLHLVLPDLFLRDAAERSLHLPVEEQQPEHDQEPSKVWQSEARSLARALLARCALGKLRGGCRCYHGGQAGIVQAIQDANTRLQDGRTERCLVVAVDSFVEPRMLQACATVRVLKTNDNPVGFAPGEAAGALLLERAQDVQRLGLADHGRIAGLGIAQADYHCFADVAADGRDLANAIGQALDASHGSDGDTPRPQVNLVLSGLNGTERQSQEWGHALVRLRRQHNLGDIPTWHPVAYFGETGAATGALAISLALQGFARGYSHGNSALVWLASHDGARGAIRLQASHN